MKKTTYFTLLVCFLQTTAFTQGVIDALKYSRMQNFGTARYTSMGGSFGALGGEISGIVNNPGGLGVYRNSEFTISTSLTTINLDNNFRNNSTSDGFTNFNIPNFGYVSSYNGNQNGWKKYSIAFGHNRIANFHSTQVVSGNSRSNSSFIDPYVQQLNNEVPFYEDLINYQSNVFGPAQAFNTFAIDTLTDQNGQIGYIRWLANENNNFQERRIETEGRQTETFIAFGGNFKERLFLGASLGIQGARFEQKTVFRESYSYDSLPPNGFQDITFYEEVNNLRTRGTGLNFKLGAIYKVNDEIRIGGAVHTPTYFGMTEEYVISSSSRFSDGTEYFSEIVESVYDYSLKTPWKFQGSVAYILGSKAIINLDYEYQDFSTSKFDDVSTSPFDYSPTNNEVSAQLQAAHQIRVGAEVREDPFVFRGGFRYESNPFADNLNLNPDESRNTYSLGTGFRKKNYNIDLSYLNSQVSIVDPIYNTSDAAAVSKQTEHIVTLTFGWKW